ncbi:MAG: hypothetical protein EBU46_20650 [Nitrosomonadaceae bacterium]|nr:hypothetical protein [Nitrosomonadaceae bacterium]
MNKTAFYRGFLKAAVEAKLTPSPSLEEIQRSLSGINDSIKQIGPSVGNTIGNSLLDRMNTAVSGGSGALMGAGLGGSLGYWLGKDEEEKKDNRGLTALLGALAGGGAGLAGGALMSPKIGSEIWPELGQSALAYGVPGAAVGGVLGYMTGRDDDPEKDHGMRNALMGAAAGGLGAGYYGANHQFNNIRDTVIGHQQQELDAAKQHWSHGLLKLLPSYQEAERGKQQEIDQFKQYTLPKLMWNQVMGK